MYVTGQFTLDPKPAQNLVMNIISTMVSVGWKVATNITVNNYVHTVLWSSNATNSLGKDWFIDLAYDANNVMNSNTNVVCSMFSSWNGTGTPTTTLGANTANGFAPANNSTVGTATGNLTPSGFYNVAANTLYANSNVQCNMSCDIFVGLNVNTSFWYTATIDRLIMTYANTTPGTALTGGSIYIGMYDTFLNPSIDTYPLIQWNLLSGPGSSAITSGGGGGLGANIHAAFCINDPWATVSGILSANAANFGCQPSIMGWNPIPLFDNYQGLNSIARLPIMASIYSTPMRGIRGLFKDFFVASDLNGTPLHGDVIQWTVGGNTYSATMGTGGIVSIAAIGAAVGTSVPAAYFYYQTINTVTVGLCGYMLQT